MNTQQTHESTQTAEENQALLDINEHIQNRIKVIKKSSWGSEFKKSVGVKLIQMAIPALSLLPTLMGLPAVPGADTDHDLPGGDFTNKIPPQNSSPSISRTLPSDFIRPSDLIKK